MFSSEFSKSATISDSNIPVPKRTYAGTKRSKGCAQLPELQRYIETIIKVSSECDSEEALQAERGNGIPRERKFGRYSVYKGNDNRAKIERIKYDSRMSARNSKNKSKTPFTEAVSNGVEISNMFVYNFEDPRNWKTDDTQNGGSKPEIESFLKKVFPNPYHLENVNTDITLEQKHKDDLGDETLAHVPLSNAHTQTEVESEKTDNASVTAECQIKPCKRGSNMNCYVDPASSQENRARPVSRKGPRRGSNLSVEFKSSQTLTSKTILQQNRSTTSTINVCSRPSSLESVSDVFSSHTQTIIRKRETSKGNSELVSSKSSLKAMKLTSSTEDFLDEISSDYDIGKLKLLNTTDSEDSDRNDRKKTSEHGFKLGPSEASAGDVQASDDLSDLQQIFDVMNAETESFLGLSLKNDVGSTMDIAKAMSESEKLVERMTELIKIEETTEENIRNDLQSQLDNDEGKEYGRQCPTPEERETEKTENNFETEQEKGEIRGVGSCIINLLVDAEKVGLPEPDSELWGDEEQKESPRQEADSNMTVDDFEEGNVGEDAGEKIDEVLQFMYDCLKKFSDPDKKHSREPDDVTLEEKKETEKDDFRSDIEKYKLPNHPKHSYDSATTEGSSESLLIKRETQSHSSAFSDDNKRKPNARLRNRKKQDRNSSFPSTELPPHPSPVARSSTRPETHSWADSPGMTTASRVHTVETQNELGSYSEQTQILPLGCSESHTSKSILPHSVKLKKSKAFTQKTIKDVLDSEERLLASYLNSKPTEKKIPEKVGDSKSRKFVVKSGRTTTAYPFFTDFKRHNSNFVICVSSLPRNLRTMAANRTSLTLSPSLSFSLSDVSRTWDIKSLAYYPKTSLMKKIPVISDVGQSVLEFRQRIPQGKLLTVRKSLASYIAVPVCLKATVGSSKLDDNASLKSSECFLSIKVKPMKKSLFVESSRSPSPGLELTPLTNDGTGAETEGRERVESLLDALEKTEGRLLLLEQNEYINPESLSSCSGNDASKCENSEMDWDGEGGHEKVHDLLLRTYNLQHKLHLYLHKMTCVQPSLPTCPLAQREQCSFFENSVKDTNAPIEYHIKEVSCPQSLKESKSVTKSDTSRSIEIQTSEQAISFSPPPSESKSCEKPTAPGTKDERELENQNEDDDSSSICSFKSSNDFSETNEIVLEKDAKSLEKVSSKEFLQKIFSEIESFKQNFSMATKKDEPSFVDSNQENSENTEERRLAEYDPKTPAKVLKTVFKGKKSVTELTIGLKDVPMTQVSNISVEKRKFSPNHTKISICILKEKPDAVEKANSIRSSAFRANTNVMPSKHSTLYFDRIRPSLSTCPTESSRVEDDISKASTTVQDTSDEDEDYKSVVSSFSTPDIPKEQKEPENITQPSAAPAPPKTFTKYRFDFYRKMDMSPDPPKPKPLSSTVCRYKELEPLKQALTEMQIRMRSIKQDTLFSGNDYYERALKLAKMSAGYCQSCGNRAVIPKDTFGYYKTLLPRRYTNHRHTRQYKTAATSNPSFYSFPSSNPDVSERFCDLDLKHSSSYVLNHQTRPAGGTFLRSSLHDIPILIQRMQ